MWKKFSQRCFPSSAKPICLICTHSNNSDNFSQTALFSRPRFGFTSSFVLSHIDGACWEDLKYLVKVLLEFTDNLALTEQPVEQAPKHCIFELNPFL